MAQSYEDLKVWQKSMELVVEIYRTTKRFPRDELYGLASQLRRAAVSVPSNIAEGKGRSDLDFARFLLQARGSLWEVETQVHVAGRLAYLDGACTASLLENVREVGRMLSSLLNALRVPETSQRLELVSKIGSASSEALTL